MKKQKNIVVPTLRFNSEYFKCPECGWSTPLLIRGDYAPTSRCENCGHVGMIRIK